MAYKQFVPTNNPNHTKYVWNVLRPWCLFPHNTYQFARLCERHTVRCQFHRWVLLWRAVGTEIEGALEWDCLWAPAVASWSSVATARKGLLDCRAETASGSYKPNLIKPTTLSGFTNQGSRINIGINCSPFCIASYNAGLSCSLKPFLNQWIEIPFLFSIFVTSYSSFKLFTC